MNVQTIIEFILALGALIFIHEFGHFIVCKLLKIEVRGVRIRDSTPGIDPF